MTEGALLAGTEDPPVRRVRWRSAIRIIPSRFPPVDLFERVADAADFELLYEVEARTNPRLRDELGEIELVPRSERVFGPGSSYIMASFTHLHPAGGRFHDGSFGAWYGARDRATAVAETSYHRARFLAATAEPPISFDMRVLEARLDGRLHDLRGADLPGIYDPSGYGAGQRLARRLRGSGSAGIAFSSVRRPGGECVAVYRPRVLSECRQAEHLVYHWDGSRIARVVEQRVYRP
jgi:hypothetical protein